jgi:3-phytase
MRWRWLLVVVFASSSIALAEGRVTLTYRGFARLKDPRAVGLSGITCTGRVEHYAVSDHPSQLVLIGIETLDDASLGTVVVPAVYPLPRQRDTEGIACHLGGGNIFVADESPGIADYVHREYDRPKVLAVPELFKDIVNNQGFESLTISPDGKTLWTANERALKRDGNPQTDATPILSETRVRLLRYRATPDGFEPAEQFEYDTSGVHDWGGQIGLCDLAALPDGRLLALERSGAMNFSGDRSIRTRIFLVDVSGATDISKPPFDKGLIDRTPVKVRKTLLFDGFVCSEHGENLEGLCLGRQLGPDRWAVIGVVDDSDGPLHLSQSAVVAFELNLNAPATTQPATQPATGKAP